MIAPALAAAFLAASVPLAAKPDSSAPAAPLGEAGAKLEAAYAARLAAAKADISKALPDVDPALVSQLREVVTRTAAAQAEADAAEKALGSLAAAKGLVDHAKGKWIGGADKGIAQAKAALAKAATDAARAAAQADLAKWEANREEGLKALAERQAAHDKLKADEPRLKAAHAAAQAALTKARADESAAASRLLSSARDFLASDRLDARLAEAVVLTQATPRGLAAFAAQGPAQARLVDELLADTSLLREMLAAGGAKFGQWGRAAEILAAILQSSPRAADGVLRRLALAVALEHARPIPQNNAAAQKASAPAHVDPLARYRHYEQAFLDGELDPAFATLGTWELRMAVNSDVPDDILAWGRRMLRTYRPDHAAMADLGWRYVMLVRTDVRYGSQNVKDDLPSLHQHQNIPLNGGVCGRRAFFGRFILRAHGIPTWGVTQHKHAALSHWTPKGWVVNLGAGFHASWWDQDEAAMSGNEFLLETQARARGDAFSQVLRARWVSVILGETARNERRKVVGGLWSQIAHRQALALASAAPTLGPLGQELGEANEAKAAQKPSAAFKLTPEHQRVVEREGSLVVPIVAGQRLAGQSLAMASHDGGAQAHWLGGHKAGFRVDVPRAGRYRLAARVATLQAGQKLLVSAAAGASPSEIAVPHTVGLWQSTPAAEITLAAGSNTLQLELTSASRGVTLKEIILTPVR